MIENSREENSRFGIDRKVFVVLDNPSAGGVLPLARNDLG